MRRLIPLVLILLATPTFAQDIPVTVSPPVAATGEYDVTEVTVTGHFPGPALWRVKKGESEIYIIGAIPVMQKHLEWDNARVRRILSKANVLLVHPTARPGVIAFAKWQFAKGNGLFKNLYDVLPRAQADRFRQTAVRYGLDPKIYAGQSPVVAVMKLREDIYDKRGLSMNDPEKTLQIWSRDTKTPNKPIAVYSAAKLIGKFDTMNDQAKQACVDATLNEIDFAVSHAAAASHAWATADLKTARDNSPSAATVACIDGAPSSRAVLDQVTNDTVTAIDTALQTPGKSIITLPLSVLLRPDGVLQQLQAKGAEVSQPEI